MSSRTEDDWRPRIAHWRRWAPYGSSDADNITKTEAENVHDKLRDRIPEDMHERVKFLTPFVKNECVSAEVLAVGPDDANMLCDLTNTELQNNPLMVRGAGLKDY